MKKGRRKRRNRALWNERYKPYYKITFLKDIYSDRSLDELEFTGNWWGFLDLCGFE